MLHLNTLHHIPEDPGVYIFKSSKWDILYIGKAKNLKKRVSQYFMANSVWKIDMLAKADHVEYLIATTESEALYLEDNLIKRHQPPYNSLLKWDNSYVYIKITNEPFSQIFITRTRLSDGAIYIGPKHLRRDLKDLLQCFRQLLQRRWCKNTMFKQKTLCNDYLFGLCKWWCIMQLADQPSSHHNIHEASRLWLYIDKPLNHYIVEYQTIIKTIKDFFYGDNNSMKDYLLEQMNNAIEKQHFEYCAKLKWIMKQIEQFIEQQHVVISQPLWWMMGYIKLIGNDYIIVITIFVQWKLIDVIRIKEWKEDESWHKELLQRIHREWWWSYKKKKLFSKKDYHYILLWDMTQVDKNTTEELILLNDKFIDAYVMWSSQSSDSTMNTLLTQLQKRYHLKQFPYTIECIDISHLSGWRASGGVSCLVWGLPYKHLYRRYQISPDHAGDDYGSLTEVMSKKFHKRYQELWQGSSSLPDLLIIDGGVGQLQTIHRLIQKHPERNSIMDHLHIISMGKGDARKRSHKTAWAKEIIYHLWSDNSLTSYPLSYDTADLIITKARDEAHRFANAYRKKQMSMEISTKNSWNKKK